MRALLIYTVWAAGAVTFGLLVGQIPSAFAQAPPADPFQLEAQIQAGLEGAQTTNQILGWIIAALGAQMAAQVANATTDLGSKRPWLRKVLNVVRLIALDVGKSGQRVPAPEDLTLDPKRVKA